MNLSQIKQLIEKYSKIVEKLDGDILKTENWGLLNLSYIINKNKKGIILKKNSHLKFEKHFQFKKIFFLL